MDAADDRGKLVRSVIIWGIALVLAIVVGFVVGGLFGRGTAVGLIFGAAVFLVLPYLITLREGGAGAATDGHGAAHRHAAAARHHEADPVAAPVARAPEPVAAPEAPRALEPEPEPEPEAAPAPAQPLAAFGADATAMPTVSERVREAARAAGAAARALGDDGAGAGAKPATLAGPRDGAADDLKRLKGVGPRYEQVLNELGIWHFDQIAGWGPGEIAWVDANLEGFSGRVVREDWVGQATILAAGGETEHSLRVDKGLST